MSFTSRPILTLPVVSAGVIAAHRFVTAAGAQAGADANALGVSRAPAAAAGEQVPVDALGTTTVEAGAAIAVGATVKADASGRAITWVTAGGRLGIAREAASAAGTFIEILLISNAA
jgi:Uncharacterized conserved protein (DUF2190)